MLENETSMTLLRHLIQTFFVLLLAIIGSTAAFGLQGHWSQTDYAPASYIDAVRTADIAFAARAPPQTGENIAITGASFVETGGVHAFYAVANLGDMSAFLHSSIAPNRTLTQIDNPVDLVGFRRDHIINRHGPGSGKSGKTEFPSNWDEQRILHNISDVATDPNSRRVVSSHGTQVFGVRDGVEIRVDLCPDSHPRFGGQISTGFPVAGPNAPVNP